MLSFASWNGESLLDHTKADRPKRPANCPSGQGTTIARYNVDIAVLSETRFADKGQLPEIGGGFIFSGAVAVAQSEAGAGRHACN